jgi:hypothetical protein
MTTDELQDKVKETEKQLFVILGELKHAINNNPATSNYVFEEDDHHFFKTAQTIAALINTKVVEELVGFMQHDMDRNSTPPFTKLDISKIQDRIVALQKEQSKQEAER